jgi:AcrR family transcriptional regulator
MRPINEDPPRLKDSCVSAARELIAERGIEHLSLRDVARRLKVSHQAPYKHYPSREHLLAEVMRRCFEDFAGYLDGRQRNAEPRAELRALGQRYLAYAASHPLEYRLMFNTRWPEPAVDTGLVRDAVHAFDILRGVLRRVHGDGAARQTQVDLDAMFIWATLHGLASIGHSEVTSHLGLAPQVDRATPEHVMSMMSTALSAPRRSGS